MVGHAASPTGIVHADMTLTRSKVPRSRSRGSKFLKIVIVIAGTPQEADDGDDRQPPCGAFLFIKK